MDGRKLLKIGLYFGAILGAIIGSSKAGILGAILGLMGGAFASLLIVILFLAVGGHDYSPLPGHHYSPLFSVGERLLI